MNSMPSQLQEIALRIREMREIMGFTVEEMAEAEGLDAEALKALKVGLCIECGCCAFQCPAHRPLVQVNKLSKTLVRDYDNRMKTLKEAGK